MTTYKLAKMFVVENKTIMLTLPMHIRALDINEAEDIINNLHECIAAVKKTTNPKYTSVTKIQRTAK